MGIVSQGNISPNEDGTVWNIKGRPSCPEVEAESKKLDMLRPEHLIINKEKVDPNATARDESAFHL